MHVKSHPLTCKWCEKSFLGDQAKRMFCGRSCAGKWKMSRPGAKERNARTMRMLRERPDVKMKLAEHLASNSNPFHSNAVRQKSIAANRCKGWKHLNGGNGRGATKPQQLLSEALSWLIEVTQSTKPQPRGTPSCYKIDIACPSLMMAIEVDGQTHKSKRVREADIRKTAFLESKGWTILRFWNKEILNDLPLVVKQITHVCAFLTSKRLQATALPKAC